MLVVDDERSIRLLCRVNLIASGIDVLEASDGREGLELARTERPDLVLLDVMMPELDGWTVARELAADEQTRDIPIVFLTARADPADRRLGEQLGGVGYVVKPFDPVTIGEFVEEGARAHRARGARPAQARDHLRPRPVTTTESSDAADRARRLQRVAELLAEAVTPQEVLDSVLTEGVRAAEARAGAIGVLSEDGQPSSCWPSAATTLRSMVGWSSFPLEADVPMSDVIRTGEPLFLASVAKERNERYRAFVGQGQEQSRARGRAARRRGPRLRRDVALLRPGRRVRARAPRDEADARAPGRPGARPLAPLRGRADAARADDLPRRGERAARLVARLQPHAQAGRAAQRPAASPTGARSTWSGRTARSSGSRWRTRIPEKVRWAYELQERYPPDPDAPTGVPQVLRTGEPEFFPELPQELLDEAIGDDEELRRIIDELGLKSTICVPLIARGRTLGALTLIAAETHPPYTQADLELAIELARRAAVAVDNARLYREAERGANAARALAYVADGVVLIDTAGRVRHWNPAAAAITGVDEDEALGRQVADVVPAWDGAHLARAARAARRRGAAGDRSDRARRPRALGLGLGRRLRRRHASTRSRT